MFPPILIRETERARASFTDEVSFISLETHEGFKYSVSDRFGHEKAGRFYVSGTISDSRITGLISVGSVNGQEAMNGGELISKMPRISGVGPYVCLKLTPNPLKAEVVCSSTFGVVGEDYFHPLALFKKAGKVAQFAYFDYNYKPFKKDGKWVHRITPA